MLRAFGTDFTIIAPRDGMEAAGNDAALGDLPQWRLTDLYSGPDDPAFEADFKKLEAREADFAERYEGKIATLDAAGLLGAIADYEATIEVLRRLMSYAGLYYQTNMLDPKAGKFLGDAQSRMNDAMARTVFFTLELNRIEEARLEAMLARKRRAWRVTSVWLERIRAFRPHQLSDDEQEKLLHDH